MANSHNYLPRTLLYAHSLKVRAARQADYPLSWSSNHWHALGTLLVSKPSTLLASYLNTRQTKKGTPMWVSRVGEELVL
jgi:hypothetical protein